MFQVEVKHHIKAPAMKVWETIDKLGDVYTYHPLVKHSESINKLPTGKGAERTCHFEDGNQIKERIIRYDDNKKYQVDIYDPGKFPLHKAIGTLDVNPEDENSAIVSFTMDFQPKFGPLGWLMAHLAMKKQFAKILSKVLQGLDTHIQTGQIIGKNGYVPETTENSENS